MDVDRDSNEFSRRLIALGELFDADLPPARVALYFEALSDMPFEAVAQGLNLAARSCRFMPKPVELRTLAAGDDEDLATRAWALLKRAMREVGAWNSVVMEDAALADTILAMWPSWPALCELDLSPEMWANTRKEFGRIYRQMRNRHPVGERYLVGISEQQNRSRGREDWLKYVEVKRVGESGEVRRLSLTEANAARALTTGAQPLQLGETA